MKIFEVPLARLLKFEEAVVVARLPTLFTPPTYAWLNSFVFFPLHLLALISCRRFIFERYDCMIFLVEVNQALIAWSFRLFHVFDNF